MSLAPLILVVGPSGAGKDALIDGARQRLTATGAFYLTRRVVTRPLSAGGEDHESVTAERFREMQAAGAFLLSWNAHGLAYGIPVRSRLIAGTGRPSWRTFRVWWWTGRAAIWHRSAWWSSPRHRRFWRRAWTSAVASPPKTSAGGWTAPSLLCRPGTGSRRW